MRLHDFIDYRARERPDVEFAIQGERRVVYREAIEAVNKLANAFVSSGLQVGDRVAVLAKNCIEYAYIYYASSKAGVVPVPLNYRLVPEEWAYIINDSGAKMLIAGADFVAAGEALRPSSRPVQQRVAMGGDAPSGWTVVPGLGFVRSARHRPTATSLRTTTSTRCTPAARPAIRRARSFRRAPSRRTWRRSRSRCRRSQASAHLIVAPMYHAAARSPPSTASTTAARSTSWRTSSRTRSCA